MTQPFRGAVRHRVGYGYDVAALGRRGTLQGRGAGWRALVRPAPHGAGERGDSTAQHERSDSDLHRDGPERGSQPTPGSSPTTHHTAARARAHRSERRLQHALLEAGRGHHGQNESEAMALPVHVRAKRSALGTYLQVPAQVALPESATTRDSQLLSHVATRQLPCLAPT
jgi:hypothetical protein